MKLTTMMEYSGTTKNTTAFEILDDPAPIKSPHINTECLISAGLEGKRRLVLRMSTEPLEDGEVDLAFPSVPCDRVLNEVVRYRHTFKRGGKTRQAPNTIELPVTLAYAARTALPDEFIAARRPLYLGVSALAEETRRDPEASGANAEAEDAAENSGNDVAGGIAGFDAFLMESVRKEEDGKLTTRRIWPVWADRWGADPGEDEIAGVRFADVAGRVSKVLRTTSARNPTRVDGKLQRFWPGYAI